MLVLVTLASVLMAFMQALHVPPTFFLLVLLFVAGVLGGQVLLFRGRQPLAASAWVGGLLFPAETAITVVVNGVSGSGQIGDVDRLIRETLLGCICTVPGGIVLGALTGVLAGGAFAMTDAFCRRLFHHPPRIRLERLREDDLDLLLAWVRGRKLLERWSAEQFTFPLDRRQLLRRLETMSGELPPRLMFKAVDIATEKMVGYVELGGILHRLRAAFIELPLLAPDAADRDLLGIAMLRSVVEKAFRELGFLQINVRLHAREDELDECCFRAWDWKYNYVVFPARDVSGGGYLGRVRPMQSL